MDAQRQQDLWADAIENFQAARQMAQQGRHKVSVARSDYAVFTAMWVALGDSPEGNGRMAVCSSTLLPADGGNRGHHLTGRSPMQFVASTMHG